MPRPQTVEPAIARLIARTLTLPAFRAPPQNAPVRLHLNEPSFAPSPRVLAALANAASDWCRYPDGAAARLREALAMHLDVDAARIVIGAGSDELIGLIAQAFLSTGERCVVPRPSFPRYRTCALSQGAIVTEVALDGAGAPDVAAMIEAAQGAQLVYVASPNNPTGAMLDVALLARLVEGIPACALLVLDEAYFEFARAAGGPDGLRALQARRGPWVLLRTFSKAYGLAGLRVGYGVCSDPALAEALNRVRGMFNVGVPAQAAALAALADEAYAREQIERTVERRERLRADLATLGIDCLPSAANFLAARMAGAAAGVVAALAGKGVLVSAVGPAPFERHIRISIGTADDHACLLDALAKL